MAAPSPYSILHFPFLLLRAACLAAAVLGSGLPSAAAPASPSWDSSALKLVDEIRCGDPQDAHSLTEFPEGASKTEKILGEPARVLPNGEGGDSRYFAYRIGEGKGLQAGKTYVLEIDYPEDAPRTMFFINHGASMARGVHTGGTLGDALHPPFVTKVHESLDMPLSKAYRTWRNVFQLHDRFADIQRPRDKAPRPFTPADGFWVVVAHFSHKNAPDSAGAAVARIRLYEVPDDSPALALPIHYPPAELPRRHLFWREEMPDGSIEAVDDEKQREVRDIVDWYEYKARQMRFLGYNTYCTDLLEFGSNQGWDSGPGGGNDWYYQSHRPHAWAAILDRLKKYPDFLVLPYYEYSGSVGRNGLGNERRATPLSPDLQTYTHIKWAERSRADLLDPDTLEDLKKLLRFTIVRYKDEARFLGAWLRPRNSQLPISFSQKNLEQFAEEANKGEPVARQDLLQTKALYDRYIGWWQNKRKAFLNALRDYLREEGVNPDALIFYTADVTEPGVIHRLTDERTLIAETPAPYEKAGEKTTTLAAVLEDQRHLKALTQPFFNWGSWEWHHSVPMYDPENYRDNEGVLPTYTFNYAYTVMDPPVLDLFRTKSGLAIVRHFALNEHALSIGEGKDRKDILGYFVADVERAGPYVRMAETLAMANGDPWHIGYLAGGRFASGSPEYVRAFNQAFLALPALPSTLLEEASSDPEVVVRAIETDGFGTYLAVANTSRQAKTITLGMPEPGEFRDAALGQPIGRDAKSVSLDLYPFQLRAIWYDAQPPQGPIAGPVKAEVPEGKSVAIEVLKAVRGGDKGEVRITGLGEPAHGTVRLAGGQIEYTPARDFVGQDSFRYTVARGEAEDSARVTVQVLDTSKARNLLGRGLAPAPVGTRAGGSSRELADGRLELTGYGAGASGSEDSLYLEKRGILGDFEATVHVREVRGPQNGMAGIVFRESTLAGSPMAALAVSPDGKIAALGRSNLDAAAQQQEQASGAPGPWLRLRLNRTGDLLTLSAAADGAPFRELAKHRLPGLGLSGQLGIFVAGGDSQNRVHATFSEFDVQSRPPGDHVLFAQDFAASRDIAAYSAAADIGRLDDIGAAEGSGAWSVTPDGALVFDGSQADGEGAAGFARLAPLPGSPAILKTSLDLAVTGIKGFNTPAAIEWGRFTPLASYREMGSYGSLFNSVAIKGSGSGAFTLACGKQATAPLPADGSWQSLAFYLNTSDGPSPYRGPDGKEHTLKPRHMSLWANGKPAGEDWPIPDQYGCPAPTGFRIRLMAPQGMTFSFDNLVVEDAAPASASVAGPASR